MKEIGTCPVCDKPLLCAPNQTIRFHKTCRTEGRKRYGKTQGIKKFEENYRGLLVPKVVVE